MRLLDFIIFSNNLTWRDIQHVIVKTSKPDNLKGRTWNTNGAGKKCTYSCQLFNHLTIQIRANNVHLKFYCTDHDYFGFGLLDADALIEEATTWKGLPKFRKCSSIAKTINQYVKVQSVFVFIIVSFYQ